MNDFVTCNNTHSMLTNSPVLYMIFVMDLDEDLEGSGEMEGMLEEVEEYRKRWRFQFNEKSKVMVVSKRKRERRRWRRWRHTSIWGFGFMCS